MKKRKIYSNEINIKNKLYKANNKEQHNEASKEQYNALFDAVKKNQLDALKEIIESNTLDVSNITRYRDTARVGLYEYSIQPENNLLHYAVSLGRDEMVKCLIGCGAKLDPRSQMNYDLKTLALYLITQHEQITQECGGDEEEKNTALAALYPTLQVLGKTEEGKLFASMRQVSKKFHETGSFLSSENRGVPRDLGRMISHFALGLSHTEIINLNKAVREISESHRCLQTKESSPSSLSPSRDDSWESRMQNGNSANFSLSFDL